MRVTISKVPEGIRLTIPSDSGAKAPTIVTLSPQEVASLVALLQAAVKADVFTMVWESS